MSKRSNKRMTKRQGNSFWLSGRDAPLIYTAEFSWDLQSSLYFQTTHKKISRLMRCGSDNHKFIAQCH